MFLELPAGLKDLLTLPFPQSGDVFKDIPKRRQTMARRRREVGASQEGLAFRGEEQAHRPAAGTSEGHHRAHVDAIQIGAFFAIYFDIYEVRVHQCSCFWIFKGLVSHDVAPVASGITDAEEDGLALGFGAR